MSQCDFCAHFWVDDEENTAECMINLDEDDMSRLMSSSYESCPYFQMDDEYKIVRKQI